jgi:pimeloyl-ACP methyl ester carboxylesterase
MKSFSLQRHKDYTAVRREFLSEFLCDLGAFVVKKNLAILFFIAVSAGYSGTLIAQPIRFELGQRTRAMEIAWNAQPNAAARQRASAHLKQAVTLFFAFKLNDAVKQVDHARFTLTFAMPPPLPTQWAASLFLLPETRLLDKRATTLGFTLDKLYATTEEVPQNAVLKVSLLTAKKARYLNFPIASLPVTQQLPLTLTNEGDFTLLAQIVIGKKVLARSEQTISVTANLTDRMAKLKTYVAGFTPYETESETVKGLAAILESLASKKTLETNYPAARLLREAEATLLLLQSGTRGFYGKAKAGQFWLTLTPGQGTLPVRMLAPAAVKTGKPLPLVIALHGAGGSENMFFENYGAGAIAKLCEQRGWLLVSPRGTGMKPERVAELIDAIDKFYPVDRSRVFVIGHSMGGGQTAAAANLTPEKFAGVAVLGGGGTIRNVSEALQNLPFFIGIGTEDFALRGAKALNDALKKANVKQITYREYPDIEHLAIVQVALKDVFAFFDGIIK